MKGAFTLHSGNGLLKCIIATPTLAAGINLPAQRVIVRDVSRYDAELGVNAPIPVLEIKQMMGRAGRPKYDKFGEAILIAKTPFMIDELKERYILNESEPIYSKLSIERALRTHILAAIASDQAVILFVVNLDYDFHPKGYRFNRQQDIRLGIELPVWLPSAESAWLIKGEQMNSIEIQQKDRKLAIELDSLQDAAIILIGDSKLADLLTPDTRSILP